MRRALLLAAAGLAALAAAPAAGADTSQSFNWAGYAIHRSHVSFRKVVGTWTEPEPNCTPGAPTYSSVWVGIGGYRVSSQALEQIGTEADCRANGRASLSAWYELVPAPSRNVRLTIHAGDRIRAQVSISGRLVTLTLADLTRHRTFSRQVTVSQLDTSSAEWILEAPSVCSGGFQCRTLPLADFGSAAFTRATAQATAGRTGRIDDRRWSTTKIVLAQGGRRFIDGGGPAAATAVPSALAARGTAFTVAYRGPASTVATSNARSVSASRLVHGR